MFFFLCFFVVLCGFVFICSVFVYFLFLFCIFFFRFWLLCVYFVVSVCFVYTVSCFGVFVQCVLCVLCTLCPVLACLYSVYCGQCVQIPYFTVCSASRMSYLLRCPDWVSRKCTLYTLPFWRVCHISVLACLYSVCCVCSVHCVLF